MKWDRRLVPVASTVFYKTEKLFLILVFLLFVTFLQLCLLVHSLQASA